MRYVSTRGEAPELEFEDVLLTGLARDGGLYVPAEWPKFSQSELLALRGAVESGSDTIEPQPLATSTASAPERPHHLKGSLRPPRLLRSPVGAARAQRRAPGSR